MILKRSVRIVKKIQVDRVWKFVSLERQGTRYVWDGRPGAYFLDWHEAGRRRREFAGHTPAQVLQAQRRKQAEIAGALVLNGHGTRTPLAEPVAELAVAEKPEVRTPIDAAIRQFLVYVAAHSPDKPETVRRYRKVLEHFERHLGHKRFLEAITRSDIDDYKVNRCQEQSQRHKRLISPSTVNFEVGTLRTFFYYFINERELDIKNPCTRFKKLRDANQKAHSRPPTYSQPELDALFAHCDAFEKAVFATLLLTGLRKRELYFLLWRDVDLRQGTLHVTGKGKIGFSPKGYEDRVIPLPPDLIMLLSAVPRRAECLFPNRNGKRSRSRFRWQADHFSACWRNGDRLGAKCLPQARGPVALDKPSAFSLRWKAEVMSASQEIAHAQDQRDSQSAIRAGTGAAPNRRQLLDRPGDRR